MQLNVTLTSKHSSRVFYQNVLHKNVSMYSTRHCQEGLGMFSELLLSMTRYDYMTLSK